MDPLDEKIIKQVEYYFSDINLSKDKFMKQAISENDGWISFDTMLKFNRLKCLSTDVDIIKSALSKSSSGLLEIGPNGIRRNPASSIPDSMDEAFAAFKDRNIYVKGFEQDATLDEIIEWLEKYGKTLNVHMRRFPKDRKFKGSIFVIFEKKEDADKFLASEECGIYKGKNMIRMLRDDYWKMKKGERANKSDAKKTKTDAERLKQEELASRILTGALLELTGLPEAKKGLSCEVDKNGKDVDDSPKGCVSPSADDGAVDSKETLEGPTVLALKQWLMEKLGSALPVGWIDVDPENGKAIVRFKVANGATLAMNKLKTVFGDNPIVYAQCELTGRILSGDEEVDHWKSVFSAQQRKAQKRRAGGRQGPGSRRKRGRMN